MQSNSTYKRYNRLAGVITKLTTKLAHLNPRDPYRTKMTDALLEKLYSLGLITAKKSLSQCDKITVSAFCRCVSDSFQPIA